MPPTRDGVLWTYDSDRDGQLPVGTTTSPWFDAADFSEVTVQGAVTNSTGATTVFVDQAHVPNPAAAEFSSADQFANLQTGAKVNVGAGYVRLRVVQATAVTTNASISLKASD